jgi:branched-chain amino acid transport system substrate-binding protein
VVLKQALDQDIRFVASTISSVAHALSDAIAKHNQRNPDRPVLFLNFNALDPALTESKCNFWHFRFETHSDTQVDVLTDHLSKQRSIRKVYLINQDYAYGQSVSRAAREMLGRKRPDVQIVGDELVPLGKVKDFSPYVAKIRASGADAVLTGNWGPDLALLVKASNEANLPAAYYTVLGAFFGGPAGIGAAGAERVKTVAAWHANATDAAWDRRLGQYAAKYKSTSDMAYLPPFRVMAMLAAAMKKAGGTEPVKVAYALEGANYAGPTGDSYMRREDHQLVAPVYVMSFAKAGQPPVKHDAEGTGYGWRTEALLPAQSVVPPVRCEMQRPGT